jgi:hypothetical protein
VQGEVTLPDRASGRSKLGYNCNLSLLGQDQGDGASWVDPTYGHCSYTARSTVGNVTSLDPGVKVIDVSDPAHPVTSATLKSPAFAGDTWESLKVNQARGLLARVPVPLAAGGVFFDIYDIKTDCAHPRLLNSILGSTLSLPVAVLGHEGGFSPDGKTYWASGVAAGSLTAVDVSNPAVPHTIYSGLTTLAGHGFDISPDGNRMYFTTTVPAGFITLDISQVQSRKLFPTVKNLGQVTFPNSTAARWIGWWTPRRWPAATSRPVSGSSTSETSPTRARSPTSIRPVATPPSSASTTPPTPTLRAIRRSTGAPRRLPSMVSSCGSPVRTAGSWR